MNSSTQAAVLLMGLMFFLSVLTVFMVHISEPAPQDTSPEDAGDIVSNGNESINDSETGFIDTDEIRESDKPISEMGVIEQAIHGLVTLWDDFETGMDTLTNITQDD